MRTLTTAQLLGLACAGADTGPPPGFVKVPADRLTMHSDVQNVRVDFQAFYNPTSNELVITGRSREVPRVPADPVVLTKELVRQLTNDRSGTWNNSSVSLGVWKEEARLSLTFDPRNLCIRQHRLAEALSKAPWSFHHINHPAGGHHPAAVNHETNQGDQIVHERLYGSGCLEIFSISRYGSGFKPKYFY